MSGISLRSVLAASFATLAFACSSGGGGDLNYIGKGPTQLGTPIAKANDPAAPLVQYCGTKCPTGKVCQKDCPTLSARGVVVVAIDAYDERGDGSAIGNIYVQDPIQEGPKGTPWSGLTLFRVTRVPSTLTLVPGTGVDIAGEYQPFPGPYNDFSNDIVLPEIVQGSIQQSYEGAVPLPIDLTVADFTDAKSAMQYVGRLVRIKNVAVSSNFHPGYHEAAIDGSNGTTGSKINIAAQLFNLEDPAGLAAVKGSSFKSVTGVLNYFYNFKLCPRTLEDIEI